MPYNVPEMHSDHFMALAARAKNAMQAPRTPYEQRADAIIARALAADPLRNAATFRKVLLGMQP